MTCDDLRFLLHAYLDGELDPANSLAVEGHVHDCPACAAALERFEGLRPALRDESLYHRPPAGLADRVHAKLPRSERTSRFRITPRRAAVAAAVVLAGVAGWAAGRLTPAPPAEDARVREVVAAHVRATMPGHLLDVESSDRHTVKPWFAGRIDFAPPVKDLADHGFPLAGGRLDYLDDRPVAALIYHCRKHDLNLFVWPGEGEADRPPRVLARNGYHLANWVRGGLVFWAVSDVQESDLREFVRLQQE